MILKNNISQHSKCSRVNQIVKPLMLPLSCAIALSMIAIPVNAGRNDLGDLEIYKAAESGGAVLTLMLDTSGSMGTSTRSNYAVDSMVEDYGFSCVWNITKNWNGSLSWSYKNDNAFKVHGSADNKSVVIGSTKIDYSLKSCKKGYWSSSTWIEERGSENYYDRITMLQDALIQLFSQKDSNGNYTLSEKNMIGLGNYSVDKDGDGQADSKAGRIIVPAKKLDDDQRIKLINAVKGLTVYNGTPAANAYAEAGAYMMGTSTVKLEEVNAYKVLGKVISSGSRNNWKYTFYQCSKNSEGISKLGSNSIYDCESEARYNEVKTLRSDDRSVDSLSAYDSEGKRYVSNEINDYYGTSGTRYYLKNLGKVKVINDTAHSGYTVSNQDTKDPANDYLNYIAPVSESQCSGYGVYFLTDGEPNGSSSAIASNLMNLSLTGNSSSLSLTDSCSGGLPDGKGGNSGSWEGAWSCMGDYSKKLRDVTNPSKRSILTAAVGFGKTFDGIKTSVDGSGKTVYHCDEKDPNSSITPSTDAKNLCKLGSEAYGGGGFYYTTDASSIADSVKSFTAKLTQIIETAPSGTITIPNDPLSSTNLQPFAYLPMLEPKIADSKYVWPGNLKKYNVYQGTLYGKSSFPFPESARLYVDDDKDGFPDDLSKTAQDLWSLGDYRNDNGIVANNAVYAGGAYARLKAPTAGVSANSTRNVYVESGSGNDKKLVNIQVVNGEVKGFENLDSDYNVKEKLYLLSFLGYNAPANDANFIASLDTLAKQTSAFNTIVKNPPAQEVKVLGGVVHSKPRQVSYGATFTDDGEISNEEKDRDDYIMFGSMDGALHLVSAEKGEETFAFIPKTIIKEQLKALKADSEGAIGRTVFGVDAPWTSSSVLEYKFSEAAKKVQATSVKAYGGLRMGGKGVYGLNLATSDKPTLLFSKIPGDTQTPGDPGFSRLGQVWSEPTVAKIRVKKDTNKYESKDVVIVAGGYDMCYENPSFKLKTSGDNTSCDKKTQAEGNAVYILDANDGSIISSISGSDTGTHHTKVDSMKHSVVAGVTALDRDDDGNVDHLYYADLGGSVYRVDLNAGAANASLVKRVVRVLKASSDDQTVPYRFYERPIVSFYTSPYQEIFASVTVASGDRSTPLSMLRNTTNPNYLFNLFDYDIAQPGIFGYTAGELTVKDKTANDLVSLPFNQNATLKALTTRKQVLDAMAKGEYKAAKKRYVYDYAGWRYPLTNFDGYSNLSGIKSVGEPLAYGNRLYTTAFSPEMVYDQADNCSARVVGGSERQVYCMPYGICSDESSIDGTAGYTRAGKGIQELTLGAYSKDKRNVKMLIGNQSLADQVKKATGNRNDYGVGSGGLNQTNKAGLQITNNTIVNDGTTGSGGKSDSVVATNGKATSDSLLGYEKYKFIPKRWYELYEKDK
ncbi:MULTISPECIES: PilC/PilY family type IV pilus protein [unclassified Psychrobacter]|uniref:PilC/PilY family type IV pilus protein n=1 Tax=unclassified Psychrobacter TaxID=196806 RepID=UPI002600B2AE|nr:MULTISPECIES: PilC/PilY family type IV pilus protein [unclassified Psychrobacter]